MRNYRAQASYQTAPLLEYSFDYRETATELFGRIERRIGPAKAKPHKGSFSVIGRSTSETAMKIIIVEHGRGKTCGQWPTLDEGVYVLFRTNGRVGEELWAKRASMLRESRLDPSQTIGIAPKHDEQFAYLPLTDNVDLDRVVKLMLNCADI